MTGPTLAVFTKNRSNPAYAAARLAADRIAARFGARTVHYVPETPDDVGEQIALVDKALAGRPDAILFVPVHETAMLPAVARINAAGIPLVNYINRLREGASVTFVGSDDQALAERIATVLFERLGGSGSVVILEGPPGAVTSRARVAGFRAAAARHPGIAIVASEPADFLREPGARVTADLLRRLPAIDGILAANDVMATGAIQALEAAGRQAAIVGVNALPEAIDAIKAGRMLATVDFDAFKLAAIAGEAAIRHLRGEPVPREIILPVQVVDSGNYAPWDKPIEARALPSWDEMVRT